MIKRPSKPSKHVKGSQKKSRKGHYRLKSDQGMELHAYISEAEKRDRRSIIWS